MRATPALVGAWLSLPGAALAAASPAKHCAATLLPDRAVAAARSVTTDDLVRLRDIGPSLGALRDPSPFAVSPDGRRIAFQIRQADPATNDYCLGMAVMAIGPNAVPVLADAGGELILYRFDNHGLKDTTSGVPALIVPKWSADGQWIAYLRQDGGTVQLWRARADGQHAEAVTHSALTVVDFGWSADGRSLWFETEPARAAQWQAIAQAGRAGWPYGERFWPVSSAHPWPAGTVARARFRVDPPDGTVTPIATPRGGPAADPSPPLPASATSVASAGPHRLAWLEPADPARYRPPLRLHVRADGREVACPASACTGVVQLWWTDGGRHLLFLRQQGIADMSQVGLYLWSPSADRPPRPILVTDDLLVGCTLVPRGLLCGRETARTPRRIVLIDPHGGAQTDLFDPNPAFAHLTLGSVRRLRWPLDDGGEAFGDLVLPPDHRPGQRDPLIIVQYRSRGFLRGGIGDEYPIFALAAAGYAVLSVDRAPAVADRLPAASVDVWARHNFNDLADRRHQFASIQTAIGQVDALGVIDRTKVGITGLSDGTSTALYGLINSDLFAAAALSTCCDDPESYFAIAGPAFGQDITRWGFPRPERDPTHWWDRQSPGRNAARLRTPMLMQLADDEYRTALVSYDRLRQAKAPVDLWVFPDEHHNKWQPAHRAAIYDRSIAWFDFWLRGIVPAADPERSRWCALADEASRRVPSCPNADVPTR